MATASLSPNSPFIKRLASSDRSIRDKAVDSLRQYLSSNHSFTNIDFLKLWKGLFFCMWMADKPKPQQQLARDIGSLLTDVKGEAQKLSFLAAFWWTMAKQWSDIDFLRMNKYLYLVRQLVNATFEHLNKVHWEEGLMDQHMDVLQEVPLNPDNMKIPNGLRFHVIDIWVDELDKVDRETETGMPLLRMLEPLRRLGRETSTKAVRDRVKEALDDGRLRDWKIEGGEVQEENHTNGDRATASNDADAEDEEDEFNGFDD